MQKIFPFLWFDDQAEDAANFYTSVFSESNIGKVSYYREGSPGEPGKVMSINFSLHGQEFTALNGGPDFNFTPAISFFVNCETQIEIDDLWDKLSEGGEILQCGWLTDKFGVSWQIVPTILDELLNDPDEAKAKSVMQTMLQMKKLVIKDLLRAYDEV